MADDQPDPVRAANQAAELLRSADEEALRSRLAFATGNFDQYWQDRAAESKARLDDLYERLNQ